MTPFLILISGPPGVGKSTLSKKIAQKFKMVHLDKDAIDEPFSPNTRGETYTREIEPKVLQAIFNLASLNLGHQMNVILDVPWTHLLIHEPKRINEIQGLAKTNRAEILIIEARISEETLYQRIQKRGLSRDQSKLDKQGWKDFLKNDCVGESNPMKCIEVDFEKSKDEVFDAVAEIIRGKLSQTDSP